MCPELQQGSHRGFLHLLLLGTTGVSQVIAGDFCCCYLLRFPFESFGWYKSTLCTKLVLRFLTGDVKIVFHQDPHAERSLLSTFWGQREDNPSCSLSWLVSYKLSALTPSPSRLHFRMGWDSANHISLLPSSSLSAFANEGLRMGAETEEEGRDFLFAQYSGSVTLAMVHHPSDDTGSSF